MSNKTRKTLSAVLASLLALLIIVPTVASIITAML
jgi:hypothetical protein